MQKSLRMVKALGASPAMSSWMIHAMLYHKPVFKCNKKSVTDDLVANDFSSAANVENVPWPSPVIEFLFEDPRCYPTILAMKTRQTHQ